MWCYRSTVLVTPSLFPRMDCKQYFMDGNLEKRRLSLVEKVLTGVMYAWLGAISLSLLGGVVLMVTNLLGINLGLPWLG